MPELRQGLDLHYNLESAVAQEQSREPYRAEIAQFTGAVFEQLGLPENPKVLDLGSGLGALGKAMPRRDGLYYIGSDHNTDVAIAGTASYDTYVAAETEKLPFGDESLNAVSGFDILNWVPEVDKTLSEVARVLKVGGTAVFFQYAEPGVNFLTSQDKVALPVVYKSGNLHVFEMTTTTFDEAWSQTKTMLEGTNELADLMMALDVNLTDAPNQLFHILLSNLGHATVIEGVILTDICRAIYERAQSVAVEQQEEIAVFSRSTNWQRFTDHLQQVATTNGLSTEHGVFSLGTHLPKPLTVTAYLLQKHRQPHQY